MITVKNLFHSYTNNDTYAVKDINFTVDKGEIFGFLGPSGAGKSTVQNLITGLIPLQKGDVTVAGYNMQKPDTKMYNKIGVCFEQPNLYAKLTAVENLRFFASMFDVPTADPMELIRTVGLEQAAGKRCGAYSKGMRQRINFARSMLNNPEMWFLDEPTSGLDPAVADVIKEVIRRRNNEGATVFLTTHNMYIADELCNRVAFIADGEIKLIEKPSELKLRFGKHTVNVEYVNEGKIEKAAFATQDAAEKQALADIINKYEIRRMHTAEATLEQIFIQVTGKGLDSDEVTDEP